MALIAVVSLLLAVVNLAQLVYLHHIHQDVHK
jgi:hypothetical protein